jgi:hypothetical protein
LRQSSRFETARRCISLPSLFYRAARSVQLSLAFFVAVSSARKITRKNNTAMCVCAFHPPQSITIFYVYFVKGDKLFLIHSAPKSYCCLAKRQCGGVGGKLETKTQAEQHRRQFDTKLYNCVERDLFPLIPRAFFHSRELLFGSIWLHNAVEKKEFFCGNSSLS